MQKSYLADMATTKAQKYQKNEVYFYKIRQNLMISKENESLRIVGIIIHHHKNHPKPLN